MVYVNYLGRLFSVLRANRLCNGVCGIYRSQAGDISLYRLSSYLYAVALRASALRGGGYNVGYLAALDKGEGVFLRLAYLSYRLAGDTVLGKHLSSALSSVDLEA